MPKPSRAKPSKKNAVQRIVDTHLKLAILEPLLDEKIVSFSREDFLRTHRADPLLDFDDETEDPDYQKHLAVEKALIACLKPAHLTRVKRIYWGGGMRVQHLIWTFWDGEGGEFDIKRLDGIEACSHLESLVLPFCCTVSDLSPLATLPALTHLTLGGKVTDITPLTGLERLESLNLENNRVLSNVDALASLKGLVELDLSDTRVTDLSCTLELPRLKKLTIGVYDSDASKAFMSANKKTLAALKKRGVTVPPKLTVALHSFYDVTIEQVRDPSAGAALICHARCPRTPTPMAHTFWAKPTMDG